MIDIPLRVMVLQRHPFQRAAAINLLQRLGCSEVLEASTGSQALAMLETAGSLDIVICDLQMEEMDGLEFIRRAAASGRLDAVVISGHMPTDIRQALTRIGELLGIKVLGDIPKPLNPVALLRILKSHKQLRAFTTVTDKDSSEITEEQLRQALIDQRLVPYYQPKFHLATGEILGLEVLVRWHHPTKGILPPSVFLPGIERFGLLDSMLFSLMHQALSFQAQAAEQGVQLGLAFNLDASQLARSDLSQKIKKIISLRSASCSSLTFELTESGLIHVPAASLENLVRLRMMGCALSIDDFGAGFSSLQRLCQLPFNEIKLDAEFVRGLAVDQRCKAVIESTLALGRTLGMSVVVEGIETDQERRLLLELGCTQGQGYWHSRPQSGSELLHTLNREAQAQWRQS